MARFVSRRVRRLHFEELEPRLAPDALLAGAALAGTVLGGEVETDLTAGGEIEVAEFSILPADEGTDLGPIERIEKELALLDSDELRQQTADWFAEIYADTERKVPNLDSIEDAQLTDYAVYASLIKGVLDGDLHGTLLFGNHSLEPLPDPIEEPWPWPDYLASTHGEEVSLDAVFTGPKFYSAVDGGSGSLGASVSVNQESPPIQTTVTFSIDGGGAGITLSDPVHVLTVPPFASASTDVTVPPGTAAGAYDGRATLDNGQTGTVPFYVVEVNDFDVHYQKPDTQWAAPDTSLANDPSVPVLWSHDTLRWRPTSGTGWTSLDPSPPPPALPPVAIAGDWDADGIVTGGLLEPEGSDFLLRNLNHSGPADIEFGFGPNGAGWAPVAGDWDGDGDATIGFFDSVGGNFFLQNENAPGAAEIVFRFGPVNSGWVPVVGDWDGDGDDNVGLYDEVSGTFFLRNQNAPGAADVILRFGPSGSLGWLPIAGDWDGDGDGNVGLYDEVGGNFFLRYVNLPGPADVVVRFGPAGSVGWLPIAGDWDGDVGGVTDIGLYSPSTGTFFLRTEFAPGPADLILDFGPGNSPDEDPVAVQMMQRPWDTPAAPWAEFALGTCDDSGCVAFGNPGVGDWAIMPFVWYGGGPASGPPAIAAKMEEPERVVVAEIQGLSWQALQGEELGGELQGDRFFPDADWVDGNYRPQVDVLIQVEPANLPIEIHFFAFDVDDPTDDNGPIDTDPAAPGGVNGNDNFGGAWFLHDSSKVITGQGTVRFEASFQPGDNFRVAASARDSELNNTYALAPDPSSRLFVNLVHVPNQPLVLDPGDPIVDEMNPANGVHTTPRLTVWRFLHLEVDSMGAILGNNVTGTILSVVPDSNPAYSKVTIDKSLTTVPIADSFNRFEGGTLTSGGNVFPVISSGSTSVIVQNLPMSITPVANSAYILHDDDDAAIEANPPEPSLALISLYNTIFIEPLNIGPRNTNNVATAINVSGDPASSEFTDLINTQKDLQSESTFWIAYVMGAFQGPIDKDNDSQTEGSNNGATIKGDGSLIYLETIRDDSAENNYIALALQNQVVVHEIGHQFTHPITIPGWHAMVGIMKAQLSGDPQDEFFDEETQKFFRTTIKVN